MSHAHRPRGDPEQAYGFVQDALSTARNHRNQAWEAFWSLEVGRVSLALGFPDEALVLYQRAASLQRQLNDRGREAAVLDATGEAYQALGRHAEVVAFHRYAIDAFRRLDEKWRLAVALHNLSSALLVAEGPRAAAPHLDEAASSFSAFDDPAARRRRAQVDALRRSPEDRSSTG